MGEKNCDLEPLSQNYSNRQYINAYNGFWDSLLVGIDNREKDDLCPIYIDAKSNHMWTLIPPRFFSGDRAIVAKAFARSGLCNIYWAEIIFSTRGKLVSQ